MNTQGEDRCPQAQDGGLDRSFPVSPQQEPTLISTSNLQNWEKTFVVFVEVPSVGLGGLVLACFV